MFGTNPSLKEVRESRASLQAVSWFLLRPRLLRSGPTVTVVPPASRAARAGLGLLVQALVHVQALEIVNSVHFHCFSHVPENLGKRSIPSDHAAVRVVNQKPTTRGNQGKRIPSWMSKHPVFCSILKQLSDDHQYPEDPFAAC